MPPIIHLSIVWILNACGVAVGSGGMVSVLSNDVEYTGWDIFYFYTHIFRNYFSGYPWQVKVSYGIVVGCIIAMIIVFTLFFHDMTKRRRDKKREKKVHEKYRDKVELILMNPYMDYDQLISILGEDMGELRKNHPKYFMSLLAEVRMQEKFLEFDSLPNLQPLANLLGVREYMEMNLLQRRNVFQTLQVLLLFQLVISEGRLANYVNSGEPDIRMMARLCYILCSENDPYRYLLEDLDAPQSLIRPMLLHYVLGWIKDQEKRMPNFLQLADQIDNEQMSAFLIREVYFYGNDEEKAAMLNYFESPKMECRTMAIRVAGALGDKSAEEDLKACYARQPEPVKREILEALLHIGSGRSLAFMVDEYNSTSSRDTREKALYCIYNYSHEGIRKFAELKEKAEGERLTLINQVESSGLLEQIRVVQL